MTTVRLSVVVAGLVLLGAGCHRGKREPAPSPSPEGFCPHGARYSGGRPPAASHEWCVLDGVKHGPAVTYDEATGQVSMRQLYDHGELVRELAYAEGTSLVVREGDYSGPHRRERFYDVKANPAELQSSMSFLDNRSHGLWVIRSPKTTELFCFERNHNHWYARREIRPDRVVAFINVEGKPLIPSPPWSEIEKRDCPFEFDFPIP